ncbi:heme exporter protein CcmD [Pelagibaculum spongiae]|uniref:Heme exporter protein D n=1 Tax=Pelagibaculum spongiae TaxID=2080658 RepID=A0A2V1GZ90_9GAMM|nr:heme exporter protein CcmD [Pelagibaculum spongiae]PVZ66680.1 heme exporter protein CcmD [Pelagibaculum spongiae]
MNFHFDSFADFLAMGGYGYYVWIAYGVFAAVMVFNLLQPGFVRKSLMAEIRSRVRRKAREKTQAKGGQ